MRELGRARRNRSFVGVDERVYPAHFATFARYYTDIRKLPAPHPLPELLALMDFASLLRNSGSRYALRIGA